MNTLIENITDSVNWNDIRYLQKRVIKLEVKVEKLREILRFYGSASKYNKQKEEFEGTPMVFESIITLDGGDKARKGLDLK